MLIKSLYNLRKISPEKNNIKLERVALRISFDRNIFYA